MTKHLMKFFFLSLLFINIIATGMIIGRGDSARPPSTLQEPTPRVYVDPQNGTANVGETYTISVKIANVTNLAGFGIGLRWGSAVLKHQSHEVYPNEVLVGVAFPVREEIDEVYGVPDAPIGTLYIVSYTTVPNTRFNGSGTVFNMTFQVIRDGECHIELTITELAMPGTPAPLIPHDSEGGYFFRPGLGEIPIADFTVSPSRPVVNRTAFFDASGSFDQDTGGNISLYIWDFGDGTILNTTEPVATHSYIGTTDEMIAKLTVLDDQGIGPRIGSQSKQKYVKFGVVRPNPVALYTITPSTAVVNKEVIFDASASFDPDPGGSITKYMWDFDDGTVRDTTTPITNHTYTTPETYNVALVVNDTEGLLSNPNVTLLRVVEIRDIEVTSLALSPTELQREGVISMNFTLTNRGQADEEFNVTAYYNQTATTWTAIDTLSVGDFWGENKTISPDSIYGPMQWEPTNLRSTDNTINSQLVTKPRPLSSYSVQLQSHTYNRTIVDVGTSTGYWTLNPEEQNDATSSPSLISGSPLVTGGWLLEQMASAGVQNVSGEFAAGNWSIRLRLYATSDNVSTPDLIESTVWIRILRSDMSDTQAVDANVEVLQDWTQLFTPVSLNKTRSRAGVLAVESKVTLPAMTFVDEYLLVELQLQVTGNPTGDPTAKVVLEVGGPTEARTEIRPTALAPQKRYRVQWDTTLTPPGNYTVKVETSELPHETNLTNNVGYSGNIHIIAHAPVADFSFTPVTPFPNEIVTFDASSTYKDLFLNVTSYMWDFGDGTNMTAIAPIVTHTYSTVGSYNVNLTVTDTFGQQSSKSKQVAVEVEYVPLDIEIDVGAMHFRGETAEFYVLVARSGGRVNASTINAFIIYNRTIIDVDSGDIAWIADGVYSISFPIPINASAGTYTLIVDASFLIPPNINLQGTALKSFLVSSTLSDWHAKLITINGTIITINSTLGIIQADMATINARLFDINGTLALVNSTLGLIETDVNSIDATLQDLQGTVATVDSAVGSLETSLTNLNATVTNISGEVATISTTLGDFQTSLGGLSSTLTIGLAAASVLSAIAAVAAILIWLKLRKVSQ